MTTYHAPAKVNLTLHVDPPRDDGYHPIHSLVQTVGWVDELEVTPAEEGRDQMAVEGADFDPEDNLVTRALAELRKTVTVPPLRLGLRKHIPDGAGLGGGSADAAAVLLASADLVSIEREALRVAASGVGSDVALFLTGGTVLVSGRGEMVEARVPPLSGFVLAVVVPEAVLSTADVYRRWDEMEGPEGHPIPDRLLPPALRGGMPVRNDLLPAAMQLVPELGDQISELRAEWDTGVGMTGSGSGLFGFFTSVEEAEDAVRTAPIPLRAGRGVDLRHQGVTPA